MPGSPSAPLALLDTRALKREIEREIERAEWMELSTALQESSGHDRVNVGVEVRKAPESLDEVLVVRDADLRAPLGADDAGRDGCTQPERVPDGDHPLPHFRPY